MMRMDLEGWRARRPQWEEFFYNRCAGGARRLAELMLRIE
jgi:hypothetical protein